MRIYNKFTIFLLLLLAVGCSKNEDDTPVVVESSAKLITSFVFNAVDNAALSENITLAVTEASKTASASAPNGTDISALTPTIKVSNKASISPSGAQDFSSPVTYIVTAEDGSMAEYRASIMVLASDVKQIVSIVFTAASNDALIEDVAGEINESEKMIEIDVPFGTDITALQPTFEIPDNARIDPTDAQDFSTPVTYTVTAEDGSTVQYEVSVEITISQKDALIAILNANPNLDVNWDVNNDLSTWSGVQLDNDEMVVRLFLPRDVIQILPLEIKFLSQLKELYVNDHRMTELPESIGDLVNLEVLELEADFSINNEFGFTELPPQITQLAKLKVVNLAFNNLTELPVGIENMLSLESLDLDRNQLTTIPQEIAELSNLKSFFIARNQITSLPAEIGSLSNLENLRLIQNEFNTLPKEIGQLSNLKILQIDDNPLVSIPIEFGNLINLRILTITSLGLTEIPSWIFDLSNLETLRFSNNGISIIPQAIDRLVRLETFTATNNRLAEIPDVLWQLNSLRYLVVNENQLTEISSQIAQLRNLIFLRFDDNQISAIPPEIGQLRDLETLFLNNNQISNLPKEIGELTKLRDLRINNNFIVSIPAEICSLESTGTIISKDDTAVCGN